MRPPCSGRRWWLDGDARQSIEAAGPHVANVQDGRYPAAGAAEDAFPLEKTKGKMRLKVDREPNAVMLDPPRFSLPSLYELARGGATQCVDDFKGLYWQFPL